MSPGLGQISRDVSTHRSSARANLESVIEARRWVVVIYQADYLAASGRVLLPHQQSNQSYLETPAILWSRQLPRAVPDWALAWEPKTLSFDHYNLQYYIGIHRALQAGFGDLATGLWTDRWRVNSTQNEPELAEVPANLADERRISSTKHEPEPSEVPVFEVGLSDEERVMNALRDPRWDFRTVEGISKETGIPSNQVAAILDRKRNEIRSPLATDISAGLVGALVVLVYEWRSLAAGPPQRRKLMRTKSYWGLCALRIAIGGAVVFYYRYSSMLANPVVALNVGASWPALTRAGSRALPETPGSSS